jgi:hypothetical protein
MNDFLIRQRAGAGNASACHVAWFKKFKQLKDKVGRMAEFI